MSKLGQCTGSDSPFGDALEARRILKIIAPATEDVIEHNIGRRAADMVRDMRERVAFRPVGFRVTGKQLFYLREIKGRLVDLSLI